MLAGDGLAIQLQFLPAKQPRRNRLASRVQADARPLSIMGEPSTEKGRFPFRESNQVTQPIQLDHNALPSVFDSRDATGRHDLAARVD